MSLKKYEVNDHLNYQNNSDNFSYDLKQDNKKEPPLLLFKEQKTCDTATD